MKIGQLLEYLGGERDLPPADSPALLQSALVTAATWILLLIVVYAFCGQSSRFIYIDF